MTDPVEVVSQKTPPPPTTSGLASYSASAITLFGVPLLGFDAYLGLALTSAFVTMFPSATPPQPLLGMALVYGFAYQGHCYDLPEPMAVVVNGAGQPAVGCGYGAPGIPGSNPNVGPGPFGTPFSQGTPYLMWQVDKLERTVLIQSTNDTFEEVILRKNLMGAKQPLSYRSANLISHRGGKLTEFE